MNAPAKTPSISASAIESFDPALGGCARKWAFQRLDGVPKPSSPGAALGTRCHELWAEYLKNGTPFDLSTPEGRICHATQHLLPAPGTCDGVEEPFRFEWEGVTWAGVKDAEYDGDVLPVVLDHKTTSDFRYAKRDRSLLLGHPQAPLYGLEACELYAAVCVELAWNYVRHGVTFAKDQAPGPHGYAIKRAGKPVALDPPVRIVVSRAEAEDALGRHVPTAKRMLAVIAAPPAPVVDENGVASIARALEPNPDACDAFGGCPYRSQCGLTPQDMAARMIRTFASGENKDMSTAMRDRIAQIKAERAAGTGGPTQSTAVGVQQAIEAERLAKEAAKEKARADEAAASLARAAAVPETQDKFPTGAFGKGFGPVNPPESVLLYEVRAQAAEELRQSAPSNAGVALPPAEAPTRPDTPASQAPKRRGRPPGSRNKVKVPEVDALPGDGEIDALEKAYGTMPDLPDLDAPDTVRPTVGLTEEQLQDVACRVVQLFAALLEAKRVS